MASFPEFAAYNIIFFFGVTYNIIFFSGPLRRTASSLKVHGRGECRREKKREERTRESVAQVFL